MKPTHARVALATAAVLAGAALVVGPGYETSQARMYSGAVWLASGGVGQATLVDGASAEVKAQVVVGEPSTALHVTQQGGAALVLNEATGALRRVDSATEQASAPVSVLPASDSLVVLPSPDAPRVADVHSGMIASVDPVTLARTGEPEHLAGRLRPNSGVVDGDGRVWAIDDTTGDVVWLNEGKRRVRAAATKNGRLVVTRGLPALVDPEHGTAQLLHPETGGVSRSLRLDLSPDDEVVVSGSAGQAGVLIAVPSRGVLIACSFDAGSCAAPVRVAAAGAEIGTPVEASDHAVVPDHSTGQATIVDLGKSRVVAQRRLFEQPGPYELIARDGIVFFNDPESSKAGVLDLWGGVRTITKYVEDPVTPELPSVPDEPRRSEQVKTGRQKPDAGLGLPGHTGESDRTPQGLTASILVKPGNRGVVGDEFELTMVLQPPVSATTRWSFDEGADTSGTSVRQTWANPGTFAVRATATLGSGKQAVAETTVIVDPPDAPPAITAIDVKRPKPVIGESVRFSANTTRDPDRWEWTVTRPGRQMPEITARTAEFGHAFTTAGHYVVTLTITKGSRTAQSSRQFTVGRGAVKAWGGENFYHELDVPAEASSGVIAVEAGQQHALALKADGRVIAWGDNEHGQLNVPPQALSGVIAISSRQHHSLALKADGSVVAWGENAWKETEVPEEAQRDVIAIAAGANHSMALRSDGSVVAWGSDHEGQVAVPEAALTGVIAITAGHHTSVAWKVDGSIVVWGSELPWSPVPLPGQIPGLRSIAVGYNVGLALRPDGSLFSWGYVKSHVYRLPDEVKSGVVAVDFAHEHAVAMKTDGTLFVWGLVGEDVFMVPSAYNRGVLSFSAGSMFTLVLLEEID
ncbi:PKD domain-containing protein [Lentzea sp. BCCO 10_0798]|uniref:PKD domain-containing protein n=1 Tax=Lentzea kristufekii TaxID=3095430 RepID=A0ABU4TK22_9PSEU|nr:PKD domain-containing protein [Lentzea sp. BCCO 10_0798]MDX8048622.1 PKD domain-containing protein [Lentzea sp. BCCO 10_0798]